jgi:redox-sensitive bicupin YhaK (pirin superfamily)
MEIITHVLSGKIGHRDSMGFESTLQAGDFQRMSAGTGVRHSEFNPDPKVRTHIVQIWLTPDQKGHKPRYDELHPNKDSDDVLACSPDGRDGSLAVHQDITLRKLRLNQGSEKSVSISPQRHAWLQVLSGEGKIDDQPIAAGDGAGISKVANFRLSAVSNLEVLLFDLA